MVEDEASASRIDVALTPGEIEFVKTGDHAFIEAAGETLAAHVEIVHKTQNRVVIAPNDVKRRLAPGSVVVAWIEVERRDNALLAPNEALRYAQGRCKRKAESDCVSRLWILRDGEATAVSVRLGASDGARTEIVGGDLKAGDILIVKELD